MEYLGRTDFVQVKPNGVQKNKAEQMEQLLAKMAGQHVMPLGDQVEKKNDTQATLPTMSKTDSAHEGDADAIGKQLSGMMGDAPACGTCGHITIRSGSCYKCLNCGSTTGCS